MPEAASLPLVRRELEKDGAEAGVQSGGACGDRLNSDRSEGRNEATEEKKKNPRKGDSSEAKSGRREFLLR